MSSIQVLKLLFLYLIQIKKMVEIFQAKKKYYYLMEEEMEWKETKKDWFR